MDKFFSFRKAKSNIFSLLVVFVSSLAYMIVMDSIVFIMGINNIDIINDFIIPNIILVCINTLYLFLVTKNKLNMYYTINAAKENAALITNLIKRALKLLIIIIVLNMIISLIKTKIEFTTGNLQAIYTPIKFYLFIVTWLLPILSKKSIVKNLKSIESVYYSNMRNKINLSKENNLGKENNQNISKYMGLLKKKIQSYNIPSRIYDSNDLYSVIQSKDSKAAYSISFDVDGKTSTFKKSKRFIKKCTNDEKVRLLEIQIDKLKRKYFVDELNTISKIFSDKIPRYRSEYIDEKNVYSNKYNFINLAKEQGELSIISQFESLSSDVKSYINSRIQYIENEYSSAKLGYDGEYIVNKELERYSEEFINIKNKVFNLSKIDFIKDDYTMECDNILITRYGIFVLEVKNKGVYSIYKDNKGRAHSRYELLIEPEGRWVKIYNDGGKEVWEPNPVVQNRDHIIKIRDIINNRLGYTQDDEEYVEVKGIVVIANENLDFTNKSLDSVVRTKSIYSEITQKNERIYNKEQMMKFKEILESYSSSDHVATKYDLVDVFEEINDLDENITKFIENLNVESVYKDIKELELEYKNNQEDIESKILEMENNQVKKLNKQIKFNNKRIKFINPGFAAFVMLIITSFMIIKMQHNIALASQKKISTVSDNNVEYIERENGKIGANFESKEEFRKYNKENVIWLKETTESFGLIKNSILSEIRDNEFAFNYSYKEYKDDVYGPDPIGWVVYKGYIAGKNQYSHESIRVGSAKYSNGLDLIGKKKAYFSDEYIGIMYKVIQKYTDNEMSFEGFVQKLINADERRKEYNQVVTKLKFDFIEVYLYTDGIHMIFPGDYGLDHKYS